MYVELQNAQIICDLALGMAPTLAAHTMVVIQFDQMRLFVALEVPRNKRVRIRDSTAPPKVPFRAPKLIVSSIVSTRSEHK